MTFPFYAVPICYKDGEKDVKVFQNLYDAIVYELDITDARNYNNVEDIPSVAIVKFNQKSYRTILTGNVFISKQAYKLYEKICAESAD